MIKETLAQARRQAESQIEQLKAERLGVWDQLRDDHAERGRLATAPPGDPRLVDAHDRIREGERRVSEIDNELALLVSDLVDESEVVAALADFDALWGRLAPREQSRVIELLVENVTYDGDGGSVAITFRPSGIKTLAEQLIDEEEAA